MKIKNINVHIKVKDFKRSLAFYEALGFKKIFSFGPDQKIKEAYRGADFKFGNTILEIADGHRVVKPEVFQQPMPSSKISLFFEVSSISKMLDRCQKFGIKIAVWVRHYHWGKLEFVIKDPDGVVLVFFQPYSKKEAKKVKADTSFSNKLI